MDRYIDLSDGRIFVSAYGDESAFPLVLLHGNSENGSYFIHQIEYFSDRFYVIAIDSRAHGKSSYNPQIGLSIEKMADDVIKVLAVMDIDKADFIGFSDGGNVLIEIAMKKPEIVNKMVINGANLNMRGVKPLTNLKVLSYYFILSVAGIFGDKYRRKKEICRLMINQPRFDYYKVADIQIPTLVIAGSKDLIKESHTRKIAELIKNSELKIMQGTHFIAVEAPQEFNKTVDNFLK